MADSNSQGIGYLSLKAGGAITKNRFVKQDTSQDKAIVQSAAGTDLNFGVALETVASGLQCPFQNAGIAKLQCGAAVAKGASIASDASGKGVTAATGDRVAAIALEAAGADLDVISVMLHHGPNVDGKTTP
jgi:hypothetical protein